MDFPLFAVRELGGDVDHVIGDAIAASDPSTAEVFTARAPSIRALSLRDCALVEVTSSYGLGFMDGLSRRYDPETDLALAAVRFADDVDAHGRYIVDSLHASDLPEVWFGSERRTGRVTSDGCVTVSAQLNGASRWSHSLLVFLAELPRRRVAADLARKASSASTAARPRTAVSVDRRLALIVGGSGALRDEAWLAGSY